MRSLLSLFLILPAIAQDIAPKDSERDPILSNLLLKEAEDEPATLTAKDDALLVTGSPPPEAHLVEAEEAPPAETAEAPSSESKPTIPEPPPESAPESTPKGPRITVQGGTSDAPISGERIALKAPFQPKVLGHPPVGWRLSEADSVPPVEEEVTLANGSKVPLSIRPYLLVPDADGDRSFALMEPGFEGSRGYAQTGTVGAILADSIHHLDSDVDRLAAASRRLTELLDSLPAAPPTPSPAESP